MSQLGQLEDLPSWWGCGRAGGLITSATTQAQLQGFAMAHPLSTSSMKYWSICPELQLPGQDAFCASFIHYLCFLFSFQGALHRQITEREGKREERGEIEISSKWTGMLARETTGRESGLLLIAEQ